MSEKPSKSTGRESDQFNLRLPDGMRERLKAAAALNNRSLNAEIVARLENTLSEEKFPSIQDDLLERLVERVVRRVVENEKIK